MSEASFEINKGEFCILLGSSGAGKTTLLNMLGGMDKVTSGQIHFDGKEISAFSKKELVEYRRHDVGFVFQFYNLIPNMAVMSMVKIDMITFNDTVKSLSYLIAFVFSVLFAVIVNHFMKRQINKVNMTESLKAVE